MAEQLNSSDSGPGSFDEAEGASNSIDGIGSELEKELTLTAREKSLGTMDNTGPSTSSFPSGSALKDDGFPVHGDADGAHGPVVSGIDRLLEKHRSEIMYELRRLKTGDRPVTGQENRKNVEDFFMRSVHPERVAGEDHRPESIVVEVSGLVESRPVSSILQSSRFRRSLENALRGSLVTISARQTPGSVGAYSARRSGGQESSLVSRTPPGGGTFTRSAPVGGSTSRHPTPSTSSRQHVTEENQVSLLSTARSSASEEVSPVPQPPSFSQALTEAFNNRSQRLANVPQGGATAPPPAPALPPIQPEERAQAWLRHQPDNLDPREQHQMSVWDSLEQGHRESIITDISELVHQQLVTSSLGGTFRDTLENQMQNRLDTTGIDGRSVQQVISQLPRMPPSMRNNFSELGISSQHPVGNHDNISDNISVISATAAVTIPQTRSAAMMGREIMALKAQVSELTNMMKLSFDLQLDIQRSIRQEVAAAINQALGGAGSSSTSAPSEQGCHPVDDSQCLICLERAADAVLYQCGHMCVCFTCGLNLRQRGSNCPVCRAPIRDIIRAYKSGNLQ